MDEKSGVGVVRLDHLVLTVRDIEASVRFYTQVLGMRLETSSDGHKALHFGISKIDLRQSRKESEPKALHAMPGSANLCFVIRMELKEAVIRLRAHGVEILEGPVKRNGAQGEIHSVYIRDPDGNLIELASYATP